MFFTDILCNIFLKKNHIKKKICAYIFVLGMDVGLVFFFVPPHLMNIGKIN